MENYDIIKKIKQKKMVKLLIFVVLAIMLIIILFNHDLQYLIKGEAPKVSNIADAEKYSHNRKVVTLECSKIYDTGYAYYEDNVLEGYYLDIALKDDEDKALIILVDKDLAEGYIQRIENGEVVEIQTQLRDFYDEATKDVVEKYKNTLATNWGISINEVNSYITNISGDALKDLKTNILVPVIVIGVILLIVIYNIIKNAIPILNIKKCKQYKEWQKIKNFDIEKMEEEYKNQDFDLRTRKIFFGKDYFYAFPTMDIRISRIDNIGWIYKMVHKTNGITTNKSAVIQLIEGKPITIKIKEEELRKIVEYVTSKNPNCVVGFTKEARKKYQELKIQKKQREE